MTSLVKKTALAGVALAALMGLYTAARADDTEAENRQLKERVKQLEAVVAPPCSRCLLAKFTAVSTLVHYPGLASRFI